MTVPLIDLSQQHQLLLPEMLQAFEQLVKSGRFILGPAVEHFEQSLAAYCKVRQTVGMSSGTDAILAALMAIDLKPSDEVITTPFTFFATAGCIARLGAVPVFVDIDPASFNIAVDQIEAVITPKTKAIIPVHLYGQMADMKPLNTLARKRGLKVIEDACQSIGAEDQGVEAGASGDIGCFSFYPTKNLAGMGDAGACSSNSPALLDRLRAIRQHGMTQRYHHPIMGGNFRLDAIQAAILDIKLRHLNSWTDARRANAARYQQELAGLPITLPSELPGKKHVYNQFTIRVPASRREELRHHLAARGIGHEVYYPTPLHLQPCFEYLGHKAGSFPQSELAASEALSLPIFPEMTEAQQSQVIQVIRDFFA